VPDPAISGHHARAAGARAAFSQDPGRSLILLRKAVDAYDAAGDHRSACSLRKTQGWYAAEAGALEEGEQALVAAIAAAERLGLVNLVAHARFDLSSPLIRLGKLERARRELELALPVFVAQHDHRLESGVLASLSSVDRLEGKHEAAVARAERALATAPTPPIRISALSFLAHALLDAGRIDEARARADEGLELLAQFGSTEEGVIVLYLVRAETRHAAGDVVGAARAIEEARANVVDRAMKISDVAIRETFLSRIWENSRTLERANEWVDIPSQEQTES
jgi:eukaryotic-like serine/threonine-protein kinase